MPSGLPLPRNRAWKGQLQRKKTVSDGYNFLQLKTEILKLSHATVWGVAKKEWKLVEISEAVEPETCLCGHFPIIELCTIHNNTTRKSVDVGNICIKRFLGFRSDLIFASLKRIRIDTTKSVGADAAVFFHERGVINSWEYGFVQDTMHKRILSQKQRASRMSINQKIITSVRRRGIA
jgi:hypothetical protein